MTIFCFLKLAFIKILSASPNGDYRLTLTVALPDGIFYAEDSTLYWMVRSINDTGISIDENALLAYRDTCEAYIADEQSKCGYSAVVVELLSRNVLIETTLGWRSMSLVRSGHLILLRNYWKAGQAAVISTVNCAFTLMMVILRCLICL